MRPGDSGRVGVAYTYKNSKGQTYYLHSKDVTLRNGKPQTIFFFSKSEGDGGGVDSIPAGREVGENPRTGLPFLRKSGSNE